MSRVLLVTLLLGAASIASGAQSTPDLSGAQWQPHLGQSLPLQLAFDDERAHRHTLAQYFGRRPVALVLMYLSCSQLCPVTLESTLQALQRAGLEPGRDLELLAVSIDPWDGSARAAQRKAQLSSVAGSESLHILTTTSAGDAAASRRLAASVGFEYLYDPGSRQYAHPAGWVLLDPAGRIERYFFGVQYPPDALRSAVDAAAAGAAPTWSQPLRLLCYCLVSLAGRYDARVLDILRALCLASVAVGGWLLWHGARRPVRPR